MPLYEFENEALGVSLDMHLPASGPLPDQIVLTRRKVPRSINTITRTGQTADQSIGARIADDYKRLEAAGQLKPTRGDYLSPAQVKAAVAR